MWAGLPTRTPPAHQRWLALDSEFDEDLRSEVRQVNIEIEREEDGRWIAEVVELPGVMTYGGTREEAITKVEAHALRVIADRLEHGESLN
jgi:predicted RNase H-like HicB family nuclease